MRLILQPKYLKYNSNGIVKDCKAFAQPNIYQSKLSQLILSNDSYFHWCEKDKSKRL